MSVIFHKE